MNNNKGFTLVELLAVIIVLSFIAAIAITSVSKSISNSKNNLKEVQEVEIINAAKKYYMTEDPTKLESGESKCINVSALIESGQFENDSIIDPTTGETFTGSVIISLVGKQYHYEYKSTECE